jgi:hypothetical protein
MAADMTAARIMSHDPKDVKQLTMGFEMGLGRYESNRSKCWVRNLAICAWNGNLQGSRGTGRKRDMT